jgi:hypothetical protein
MNSRWLVIPPVRMQVSLTRALHHKDMRHLGKPRVNQGLPLDVGG